MLLKKPEKRTITPEMAQAFINAGRQIATNKAPKTYDTAFPVFEVPINEKKLVYIPNYTQLDPNGNIELRADRYTAHTLKDGNMFLKARCIAGSVNSVYGHDGTCPLCNAIPVFYDYTRLKMDNLAEQRGLEKGTEATREALKEDYRKDKDTHAIRKQVPYITFPICIIDAEIPERGAVKPRINAEGKFDYQVMWYTVSVKSYEEKWIKNLESVQGDDEDEVLTCPAGLFAVLDYTYDTKGKDATRSESARSLNVIYKNLPKSCADIEDMMVDAMDKAAEDWTPVQAQQTVVDSVVRDMADLQNIADTLANPVRDKLAMAQSMANATAQLPPTSADNTLANFGVNVSDGAEVPTVETGALPVDTNALGEVPNVGIQ